VGGENPNLKGNAMIDPKPDFDLDELNKIVREIIFPLEDKFNEYEKTHGSNFTASLAATLAKELLVRLATTSDNVGQIHSTWKAVYDEAQKSLVNLAEYALFVKKSNAGSDARH
jgi:hypothetical protein